jgi:hypothetical protein|uniref:Uncharacterized protein n=1 Tax=Myoviridae sp. ctAca11 TaxID=2825043 RepID=A0A8S5Q5S7_9CAUD|nr:MAG TPA: hypothetical protein [Myoviridae sp. ctAca11]
MEELKIHGKYKKEDGKKIMRIINEIKVKGMQLAQIVDENDMPIIANIIAGRLLQYSVEKGIERGDKMMGEIEDKFLHGMMLVERDNTLMTVEEFFEKVEADFDRIVIQNKDGLILYYGDRSAGIPEKLKNACADHMDLSEDLEAVITLAR